MDYYVIRSVHGTPAVLKILDDPMQYADRILHGTHVTIWVKQDDTTGSYTVPVHRAHRALTVLKDRGYNVLDIHRS